MDPIYIPQYDGYIVDNPNIDFVRCDGKVFSYDEVNTANMSDTSNSLTVSGGQGRSPLAYIDTDRNTELTFTSSLFTLEMFEMANAEEIEEGDYATLESKLYDVNADNEIVLPFEVQEGSVKIRGFEEADEAATGKFSVEIADASEEEPKTVITFDEDDVEAGDTLRVAYKRRVVNGDRVTVKTDSTTAKGSLYAHYPLYSSGSDCSESSRKGTLHIYFPKCRATALPGFDASYKSAQAPGVTFSTIDPKRADKKIFDILYEQLDGEVEKIITLKARTFQQYGAVISAEEGASSFTIVTSEREYSELDRWSANFELVTPVTLELGKKYKFGTLPDDLPEYMGNPKMFLSKGSGNSFIVDREHPVIEFEGDGATYTDILFNCDAKEAISEGATFTFTPTLSISVDWD